MSEAAGEKKGVIEGASRILRELLRTPRFRNTLRILLNELDPENAPLLVRTLREEDPVLFLNLLSVSPAFANAVLGCVHELLQQLLSFPEGLPASFFSGTLQDVEAARLGEIAGLALALAVEVSDREDASLGRAVEGFRKDVAEGFAAALSSRGIDGPKAAGAAIEGLIKAAQSVASRLGEQAGRENSPTQQAVSKLAEGIRDLARSNPAFIQNVVRPLAQAGREALDRAEEDEQEKGSDGNG